MTSSTEILNGDQPPPVVNKEPIPHSDSDALLATLVQIIENLAQQIKMIPKPPPTPPSLVVSPSDEEIVDNHSAHQFPLSNMGQIIGRQLSMNDFLKTLMRKALTNFEGATIKAQKHMDFKDMFAARLHSTPPD
ncbi:hypothetical protein CJ030_MR2G022292 [Morella rubra]|uniref:Uncharacterized protein n=1 Tax=Morella rubra TaxID=262757 RepID=A0A6A1WC97_9ROSI|nr:hypothetical protein CJ030_MR2G022292 [Morella rubra]